MKSLGVDTDIDYTKTAFENVISDVDVVLDAVGSDTLERSFNIVKSGGKLLSLMEVPSLEKAKQLGIHARFSNGIASKEAFMTIGQLVAEGKMRATISKEFVLPEIRQAHELCKTGHGRGRIVLQVGK